MKAIDIAGQWAPVWIVRPGARITPRQVANFRRLAKRESVRYARIYGAFVANCVQRDARWQRRAKREAYIKRWLAKDSYAWQAWRQNAPQPSYEELNPNKEREIADGCVYVTVNGAGDALTITAFPRAARIHIASEADSRTMASLISAVARTLPRRRR